jgi:hypothetical protein
MADPIASSTQAPSPRTSPPTAREPQVSRETAQRTERAEAPPEDAPVETRRPDPDERLGTRIDTDA